MPVYTSSNGVEGMELKVTIMKGEGLAAKDRNLMGQRTTSDPYCVVFLETSTPGARAGSKPKVSQKQIGKTKTVMKNLSPTWDETWKMTLPCSVLQDPKNPPTLICKLYDYDKGTDDDEMGTVKIPLSIDPPKNQNTKEWYEIPKKSANNAKGKLQVGIKTVLQRSTEIKRGNAFPVPSERIRVGLAWDLVKGKAVDLDAACVALDNKGRIDMENSVYYGNLENPNKSITHSGDSRDGNAEGEDESMSFRFDKIPPKIVALYIVLCVATPKRFLSNIESARITIVDESKKGSDAPVAVFQPSRHIDSGDATTLFLVRMARKGGSVESNEWILQPIEDTHPTARDFGSLIPYFKSYTKDLIPKIEVDPTERVSIMRKGGTIQVKDFCPEGKLPERVTFGLSWDMGHASKDKKEEKIDLDASAICMDADLQCVDKVWFKHLTSDDGSIKHGGDERRGDKGGDDERIYVELAKVSKKVQYIGFVVNSYSG